MLRVGRKSSEMRIAGIGPVVVDIQSESFGDQPCHTIVRPGQVNRNLMMDEKEFENCPDFVNTFLPR